MNQSHLLKLHYTLYSTVASHSIKILIYWCLITICQIFIILDNLSFVFTHVTMSQYCQEDVQVLPFTHT